MRSQRIGLRFHGMAEEPICFVSKGSDSSRRPDARHAHAFMGHGAPFVHGRQHGFRERLECLACGFDLQENYFAWQAFGRRYASGGSGPLPPYLQRENFDNLKSRIDGLEIEHRSFTEYLAAQPDHSLDAYVLLDAQDWMTDEILTGLWREIARTAKPGGRVIFRTAGAESILPGRVPDEILSKFSYDEEKCRAWTERDRSSIYGGFHQYIYQAG